MTDPLSIDGTDRSSDSHILHFCFHCSMEQNLITVKCLSIGTPKNNSISICSKSKIDYFGVPKFGHTSYSLILMCSNIGTPKTINFPFGINGKLMVFGVPILKHFRVLLIKGLHLEGPPKV